MRRRYHARICTVDSVIMCKGERYRIEPATETYDQSHLATALMTTTLSLIIPVYNEASRVEQTAEQVYAYFASFPELHLEVIVVDDGSEDDTVARARVASERFPDMRVIQTVHGGKARAVLAGMAAATGDIVGFTDVDLATPIETWADVAERLDSGADVVIASRESHGAKRLGEPWYRHAMGRIFNGLVRLLLLPGIDDTQCGFKFFTRSALDKILPRVLLYRQDVEISRPQVTAFDVELLFIARQLGLNISVIPVTWTYGTHSKVNPITDTLQNMRDVAMVRINGWRGRYDC